MQLIWIDLKTDIDTFRGYLLKHIIAEVFHPYVNHQHRMWSLFYHDKLHFYSNKTTLEIGSVLLCWVKTKIFLLRTSVFQSECILEVTEKLS